MRARINDHDMMHQKLAESSTLLWKPFFPCERASLKLIGIEHEPSSTIDIQPPARIARKQSNKNKKPQRLRDHNKKGECRWLHTQMTMLEYLLRLSIAEERILHF